LSSKEKPHRPTKWRMLPVPTQVRAMFPVFQGISGSTKTT